MKTQKISKQELEWINFLFGKIKARDLGELNKDRLAEREAKRQAMLDNGIVPIKNIDGGIVL